METRKLVLVIEKHAIYSVLLLFFYIMQEIPAFTLLGVRASPVIGLFVAIAVLENEFVGALYALAAGILCDTAAAYTFGIASLLFIVMGCAAGLCVMYFFNSCPRTTFFITLVEAGVYNLLGYYVLYGIWGYADAVRLILPRVLPATVLTALWGLILFFPVRFIRDKFAALTED